MKQELGINGTCFQRGRIQLMTMPSALDHIIQGVLEDVQARKRPISSLIQDLDHAPKIRNAVDALSSQGMSLIAEVKRSSPSKGDLAEIADPVSLAHSYQVGGADLISVLTEQRKFKGKISDLLAIRESVRIPILRKDFIVTDFQVYESRIIGSDLILLIVAALSRSQLFDFYQLANELGMQCLVEVHNVGEAEIAVELGANIIGVNSRNLKTLEVDPKTFELILPNLPDTVIKVAESGISTREEVEKVESLGANAILVGEALVKAGNPVHTIKQLLNR
jgi:indole-3-glycerol phosphate synthase